MRLTSIEDQLFVPSGGTRADKPELLQRLERLLDSVAAVDVKRTADYVTFKGGLLRPVLSTNILLSVDYGTLSVREVDEGFVLEYDLSLKVLVWIAPAAVVVVLLVCRLDYKEACAPCLLKSFLAGAALFGGNYVLTRYRFPRWLDRGMRGPAD